VAEPQDDEAWFALYDPRGVICDGTASQVDVILIRIHKHLESGEMSEASAMLIWDALRMCSDENEPDCPQRQLMAELAAFSPELRQAWIRADG